MKFVSKSSNLLVVLRPGFQAQPLTGTPAKPTISVRFKDGIADVQQEELVTLMLAHPGYNLDYISADMDPYAASRGSSEPTHVLTEMKFGTPVSRKVVGAPNFQVPPEMTKIVEAMASEMAKKMLPSMLESTLKSLVKAHEEDKKAAGTKVKGKPGRKPKPKIQETPVNTVENVPPTAENPIVQESAS